MNGTILNDDDLNFNALWGVKMRAVRLELSPIYDDNVPSPRKGDTIQRTTRCFPILKNMYQTNVLYRGAQQRSRWAQVGG
jgi:hypothetical protein